MRTLRHLVIFALVAVVAVFLAAPSAMAKKQLGEDELELITAAGQPKIMQTEGTSAPIAFTDAVEVNLAFDTQVQMNINALSLNNVAGENQLATGINIENNTVSVSGAQTVSITQSWGSIKDITAVVTSSKGGTGCADGAEKCILTKGGNASSKGYILSMMADDILHTEGDFSFITTYQYPQFDLVFAAQSQQALSALVVNNVAGQNQVATGINIEAGGLTVLAPGISVAGSAGLTSGAQTVNIQQWRGVPGGRPLFATP